MGIWLALFNYGSSWKAHKYLCEFLLTKLTFVAGLKHSKSLQITSICTFYIDTAFPLCTSCCYNLACFPDKLTCRDKQEREVKHCSFLGDLWSYASFLLQQKVGTRTHKKMRVYLCPHWKKHLGEKQIQPWMLPVLSATPENVTACVISNTSPSCFQVLPSAGTQMKSRATKTQ